MMLEVRIARFATVAIVALSGVGFLSGAAGAQTLTPLQHDRHTPTVEVFQLAKGAVVNISTERLVSTSAGFFGMGDDMFDEIFQSPFDRKVPVQSLGSGFLIHPQGYIVTNEHVVRRAEKITVSLSDGVSHPAEVISSDPVHDLAIIKMEPPAGQLLPALPLGRSDDLMIGETVVAIGNPFGYQNTVTAGVISALNRELNFSRGVQYKGLIQTDTSINPGNSGGPLLNINAQVIGINSAIRGDAQGIGFAIPIEALVNDLPRLLDFRRINRLDIGMDVEPRQQNGQVALVVGAVAAEGPAQRAGLQSGTVLQAIDGVSMTTPADFYVAMLGKKPGEVLRLSGLSSDGQPVEAAVTLSERAKPSANELAKKWLGMTVRPVTPELAQRMRLSTERGLLVTSVVKGSPAEAIGVKVRDVIFQLDQTYVTSLDELGRVLEDVSAGQNLRIGVARGSIRAWGQIQAGEAPPAQDDGKGSPSAGLD